MKSKKISPAQEVFIHIVHSPRIKPLKKQPAVKCVEAKRTIDKAYLAELAGSDEYVSIAFCYKNYNEEANPRLSENESCAVIVWKKPKSYCILKSWLKKRCLLSALFCLVQFRRRLVAF